MVSLLLVYKVSDMVRFCYLLKLLFFATTPIMYLYLFFLNANFSMNYLKLTGLFLCKKKKKNLKLVNSVL